MFAFLPLNKSKTPSCFCRHLQSVIVVALPINLVLWPALCADDLNAFVATMRFSGIRHDCNFARFSVINRTGTHVWTKINDGGRVITYCLLRTTFKYYAPKT